MKNASIDSSIRTASSSLLGVLVVLVVGLSLVARHLGLRSDYKRAEAVFAALLPLKLQPAEFRVVVRGKADERDKWFAPQTFTPSDDVWVRIGAAKKEDGRLQLEVPGIGVIEFVVEEFHSAGDHPIFAILTTQVGALHYGHRVQLAFGGTADVLDGVSDPSIDHHSTMSPESLESELVELADGHGAEGSDYVTRFRSLRARLQNLTTTVPILDVDADVEWSLVLCLIVGVAYSFLFTNSIRFIDSESIKDRSERWILADSIESRRNSLLDRAESCVVITIHTMLLTTPVVHAALIIIVSRTTPGELTASGWMSLILIAVVATSCTTRSIAHLIRVCAAVTAGARSKR